MGRGILRARIRLRGGHGRHKRALEIGEAVFIRGPEHFWENITAYACAGAPIRDPLTRRVQGVLDLSCLAKDSSPMMRVLVQEAARDIEAALRAEGTLNQQAVLDRFLQVSRTSRSPVLSLSGGVFMIDARASEQLPVAVPSCRWRSSSGTPSCAPWWRPAAIG